MISKALGHQLDNTKRSKKGPQGPFCHRTLPENLEDGSLKQVLPDVVLHANVENLPDELRRDVKIDIGDGREFSSAQAEKSGGMPWFGIEFQA